MAKKIRKTLLKLCSTHDYVHETSKTRVSGTGVFDVSGMYPTLHYVDVIHRFNDKSQLQWA